MNTYLYNIRVREYETDLCKLEFKALFGFELNQQIFLSKVLVDPSISPYIKNRIQIIYKAGDLSDIVKYIVKDGLKAEEFLVKYVSLVKKDEFLVEGKNICKKVGYVIEGNPSFSHPKIVYGVAYFNKQWYFGLLEENNPKWRDHNNKPHSYSSSIDINVAKALLNIGSNGDTNKTIIDPCCGVGTVLLEACFSGYTISGCEINRKVACNARENLDYFNYKSHVTIGDIKDIKDKYDVSIVDLPYGNFSLTSKENQVKIIYHAKRISKRIVLICSDDISDEITKLSLKVIDKCSLTKRKNKRFIRYVWVCES